MSLLLPSLVIFLAPLAAYLSFLAYLNRRPRPTLIRGVWDSAGLLFAVSGFLLYGGPMVLNGLYLRELASLPVEAPASDQLFDAIWRKWTLLWGLYFLTVVGFAVFFCWLRSHVTVIYNVDAERFRQVLLDGLEELHLDCRGVQGRIELLPRQETAALGSTARNALCQLEFFPGAAHLTITWYDDDQNLRRSLEPVLVRRLADAAAWNNPSLWWLMGLSGLLCGALFFLLGIWITMAFFPKRLF